MCGQSQSSQDDAGRRNHAASTRAVGSAHHTPSVCGLKIHVCSSPLGLSRVSCASGARRLPYLQELGYFEAHVFGFDIVLCHPSALHVARCASSLWNVCRLTSFSCHLLTLYVARRASALCHAVFVCRLGSLHDVQSSEPGSREFRCCLLRHRTF